MPPPESPPDFRPGDSVLITHPSASKQHLMGCSGVVCLSWPRLSLLAADIFNDETGRLEVHYFYTPEVTLQP